MTPGVVLGLVWTSEGSGDLLFIEATLMPGTGQLQLTGQLGSVIQESSKIALSWVRSNVQKLRLKQFEINENVFKESDIHVHFPAGAVPKDGPR